VITRAVAALTQRLRPLAWATLVANIVLVVTGGAVRLTGSGLGCPTWPRCTESSFTPHGELDLHEAIEFGNRMLFFVLAAIAIATFLAVWGSPRRDLRPLAFVLGLGIPAQAVIGGVTVLTDLNPWVVSFHLLCSLAIIGLSVLFLHRLSHPAPTEVAANPVLVLAWITFASAWVVLYLGTVVTGSGPHAGDEDVDRNGLDPLQVSQLHADSVFLFLGLVVGLTFAVRSRGLPTRPLSVLVGVVLAQGAVGFVQYSTDLPIVLVGLHMLGAALVSAAVTWVLVSVREPDVVAPGGGEPGSVRRVTTDPQSPPPSRNRPSLTAGSAGDQRIEGDGDEEQ
jgi:cytochrome c oxidase assembly protein subunit 15